jgi:hypothetical protein
MEAFQIFTLHFRAEITRQNPLLTNSELTSLSSQVWRSLPDHEKQEYVQLAINSASERRPVRKRRPKPKPDDIFQQDSTTKDSPLPFETIKHIRFDDCLCFSVIPRGSSGALVASTSHDIVFPGRTELNLPAD